MIYLIQETGTSFVKIGYTNNNPAARLAGLQTGNPRKLNLIGQFEGDLIFEKYLHKFFKDKRLNGEWFNLNEDDIKKLKTKTSDFKLKAEIDNIAKKLNKLTSEQDEILKMPEPNKALREKLGPWFKKIEQKEKIKQEFTSLNKKITYLENLNKQHLKAMEKLLKINNVRYTDLAIKKKVVGKYHGLHCKCFECELYKNKQL